MEFWEDILRNTKDSWITNHSIWIRLRDGKKDKYKQETFIEDEKQRGFIVFLHDLCSNTERNVIYFAYTRKEFRKQGVLKSMLDILLRQKKCDLIAEVCPNSYQEVVWKKLGFKFHREYDSNNLLMLKI